MYTLLGCLHAHFTAYNIFLYNFVHNCTYLKLFLGVGLQLGRNWWFKILCSCEIIALVLSLKAYV